MPFRSSHAMARALRRLLVRAARGRGKAHPGGPIDMGDPIGGAVRDAELLVAFAAQSNRRIPNAKVTELVHAAAEVSAARSARQPLSAEQSARFWAAYDAVAVEMAPLSAHSIRSSLRVNATHALKSIPTHLGVNAWLALMVFFVCVALQVFWVAGKDLVDRSEILERERAELQTRMLENAVAIRRTELLIEAKECSMASGQASPGRSCPLFMLKGRMEPRRDPARVAAAQAELDLLRAEVSEKDLQGHGMLVALQSLRARGKPVETLLERWHARAEQVCRFPYIQFVCLGEAAGVPPTTSATLRSSLSELRRQAAPAHADGRQPLLMHARLDDLDKRLADGEKFERMVVEVRLIVANIGTYLIAMAMGVLGALTFILRTTSDQLREHTYVPVSISMSMVRICLGAIAGVFGSLLMPSGDATLKSLPPLFIPFVFGYAIEILFSLMDKVVHNFTQASPPAGGAAGAARS